MLAKPRQTRDGDTSLPKSPTGVASPGTGKASGGSGALFMPEVLIVEDEPEIAELVEFHLGREGLPSSIVHSGRQALERIKRERPDLVILDLMLPDLDGFEVCRRIKSEPETRKIPVIMVTAKSDDADVVTGIELGADDYVVKPFSPKVLVARVKNALRRTLGEDLGAQDAGARLSLADGRLVVDPERHQVTIDGQAIDLTLTEFTLLRFLAARPGFVRTRDQIIAAVHGRSTVLSSRTVDVHVTAIRRKLGDLAGCVETVRGVGYRFADPAAVA